VAAAVIQEQAESFQVPCSVVIADVLPVFVFFLLNKYGAFVKQPGHWLLNQKGVTVLLSVISPNADQFLEFCNLQTRR